MDWRPGLDFGFPDAANCHWVKVSHGALTSILGTCCSSSCVEVYRGGKPKRRVLPSHQGMGMSCSGKPASMSTARAALA